MLVSTVVSHVLATTSVMFVMMILRSLIGITLYVLMLVLMASVLMEKIIFVLHVLKIVINVSMIVLVVLVL
jgi:hypothetical protein